MKKKIFSLKYLLSRSYLACKNSIRKKGERSWTRCFFCNIIYCDRKAQKPANLDRKLSPELHPTLPTPAGPFFRGKELLLSSRP